MLRSKKWKSEKKLGAAHFRHGQTAACGDAKLLATSGVDREWGVRYLNFVARLPECCRSTFAVRVRALRKKTTGPFALPARHGSII